MGLHVRLACPAELGARLAAPEHPIGSSEMGGSVGDVGCRGSGPVRGIGDVAARPRDGGRGASALRALHCGAC